MRQRTPGTPSRWRSSGAAWSAPRWCGCSRSRPATSRPGSARPVELAGVAVRRIDAPRDVEVPEGLLTTDAAGPGGPRRRRPRGRGHRRHRARPHPDPLRARARRQRRHAPTRRCSPRTARPCSRRPRRPGATSTTRPPSPARSRSCARCASRWPATGSPGCSASSTAPPTSSSTRWTPRAPASPRRSRRPRTSATPRPTRPPTSRASTPPPRPRSSPRWPSTPASPPADVHREGISRGHRRRRRTRRARWAAWSSCSRSASCAPASTTPVAGGGRPSPCACTRR